MDLKLELVLIPVSDVDRAKAFYTEQLGFYARRRPPAERGVPRRADDAAGLGVLDHHRNRDHDAEPGSYRGTHLVVADIEAAREELVARGVDVSDVRHFDQAKGEWQPGSDPSTATTPPSPTSRIRTATRWVLQEVRVGRGA